MADGDEGPDFSYAFGGGAPWNPALRKDHEEPTTTDTHTDTPDAHPQQLEPLEEEEDDELPTQPRSFDSEQAPAPQHKPTQNIKEDALAAFPTSDDDFFDRYGTHAQETSHNAAEEEELVEQDDAEPEPVTQQQGFDGAWDVEEAGEERVPAEHSERHSEIPIVAEDTPFASHHPSLEQERDEMPAPEVHAPEEKYEFQGEPTLLDEALEDNAEAPLVDPENAAPTDPDWGATEDVFKFDQQQQDVPDTYPPPIPHSEEPPQSTDLAAPTDVEGHFDTALSGELVEETSGTGKSLSVSGLDWAESESAEPSFDLGPDTAESAQDTVPEMSAATFQPPKRTGHQKNLSISKRDWGTTSDDSFDFGASSALEEPAATNGDHSEEPAQPSTQDLEAIWGAALDDDELLDEGTTDGWGDVDASNFLGDDSGELLDDNEDDDFAQQWAQSIQTSSQSLPNAQAKAPTSKYAPASAQDNPLVQTTSNPYAPSGPQFTDLSRSVTAPTMPQAPVNPYNRYASHQQQPATRPTLPSSAQSFADKARTGYASPYDLPEDIAPKKRVSSNAQASRFGQQPPQSAPAPPRSSSLSSYGPPSAQNQPPSAPQSVSSLTPPGSRHSAHAPAFGTVPPPAAASAQVGRPASGSSGFFEDLPVVSRPRHAAPSGRFTPQPNAPPSSQYAPLQPPPSSQSRQSSYGSQYPLVDQLRQPERLPVFPDSDPAGKPLPPAPVGNQYSQAPQPQPPPSNRYSPAPVGKPPSQMAFGYPAGINPDTSGLPRPSKSFAPRTSSPLAQYNTQPQQYEYPPPLRPVSENQHVPQNEQHAPPAPPTRPYSQPPQQPPQQYAAQQPMQLPVQSSTPPPPRSTPPSSVTSPSKRNQYVPQSQPSTSLPEPSPAFALPLRSRTQSPTATLKNPKLTMSSVDRPTSSYEPGPLSRAVTNPEMPAQLVHSRQRALSQVINFIVPQDERAQDHLERWKGCPIFKFGPGGSVVSSFPKQVPRYGAGKLGPMIKCAPGEVKTQNIRSVIPLEDHIAKFPGPLKKGKKKEVLAWLKTRIEAFEMQYREESMNGFATPEEPKRMEEKILLWKVVSVLVENDGVLEGTPATQQVVRNILSTETTDGTGIGSGLVPSAVSFDTAQPDHSLMSDPVDPAAIAQLRSFLGAGEREKAVWHAVDQRLWAHAMLISSTLSKDIWKQVVQEFVRQEVKKIGGSNEALAALYEIFAGNWEESVDELVPASARAGLQMVSKRESFGASKDALAGLERWRETLLLVLSNRSMDDVQALVAMGKLLAGYGRVEAAHICYIFGKSVSYFGGADDPQTHMSLLGADHIRQALDIGHDIDSIMLSQVYEFAASLTGSAMQPVPHLQMYKLYHASLLAEYGHRTEALAYCDSIASLVSSKTTKSPYYNTNFLNMLEDLHKRVSQSPKDPSTSWISKPTMDKVSSSVWSRLNTFIQGEEDDQTSNGSKDGVPNEIGPFAKLSRDSPTISRSTSHTDMYGSYQPNGGANSVPPANSKYAPASTYAPRRSNELTRPRYEPGGGSSPYGSSRPSMESPRPDFNSIPEGVEHQPPINLASSYPAAAYTPPQTAQSYSPYPESSSSAPTSQYAPSPYQPAHHQEEQQGRRSSSSYRPDLQFHETSSYGYEPPSSSSYEPPTHDSGSPYGPPSSYEPPTYMPYQPDPEPETAADSDSLAQGQEKKKKSFMDDDDDNEIFRKAEDLKKQQRAQQDREADEAFRKAAEADAAKDKPKQAAGGGWSLMPKWFKKDPNAQTTGPIRAKLGEESSFVYDTAAGRWVNKKAGATDAAPAAPTPPPPRGAPMNRSSSAASMRGGGPPPGPPSRSASGFSGAGTPPPPPMTMGAGSRPPSSASFTSPPMPIPIGSRTDTPDSTTGSASGTPSQHPLSREVSTQNLAPPINVAKQAVGMSLSNASSIDDLIGAPGQGGRKGTVGRKKKGGRYVDVMAGK
ncbi:hypothetical protein K402DRAFT_365845 [Aulographum hederae CBS 113979]|uniref:Protein transport protein sec16 n=1 Tax=Aulographum hederae CBS 113979 TaxID=1176131 RepID=A0A6G1GIV7_9PEZI|nr:hypothetical protein K402DRAFT_365845 [Aulographum hederae CBS 113979]